MKRAAVLSIFLAAAGPTLALRAQPPGIVPIGGPVINGILPSAGPAYVSTGAFTPSPCPPCAAPGSLVSIYGSGLASSTASADASWPVQLAGVTVSIDDLPCLLNYAGPTQVNALVPEQLQPGTHRLTLKNSAGVATQSLIIRPIFPAFFSSPDGSVIALDADYSLISSSHPAVPGQVIALFATGVGTTTETGGLAVANIMPDVVVYGIHAKVIFAGRAPGFPGLDQINIQVPSLMVGGGSVLPTPLHNVTAKVNIVGQPLPATYVPGSGLPGTCCWVSGGYTYASNTVTLFIQ